MRTSAVFMKVQFLQQSGEHPLYYKEFGFGLRMFTRVDHVRVSGEEKKILDFAGRAHGHMQELLKFAPATAAAAFRNIGWDGPRCTGDLTAESVSLVLGLPGDLVDPENQMMAPSPNVKFSEFLHERVRTMGSSPCIYLQLNTSRRGHYVQ